MKKSLMILSTAFLSFSAQSAVDYTHCMNDINKKFGYFGGEGFPFSLEKDGKIKSHSSVNYKVDEKTKQEIIEYGNKAGGFQSKVVITRDEYGNLSNIENHTTMSPEKIRTGLGSGNNVQYNPFFMPGMGYGMGGMMPSSSKVVTDFKVQNGKCVPSRSYGETALGNTIHGQMNYELQVCKDVHDFLKKNPNVASCFSDSVNGKISSLFKNHKERNKDLYSPKENKEKGGESAGWGGFGTGGGYGYPGTFTPYGMSMDSIVNNVLAPINKETYPAFEKAPAIVELHKLSQICNSSLLNIKEMVADDDLWKKELGSASPANEKKGVTK